MLTTTNYNLKKPELTDSPPDITATNANWDTLDTNLKDAQDKATNWDTFRKNGGEIGGDITTKNIYMPSGLISSGGMTLNFKGADQKMLFFGATDTRNISGKQECGLVVIRRDDGSGFSLRPTTDGRDYTDLGANTHKFANGYFSDDLFINGYSKSANGYTKLLNGMILQWGIVDIAIPTSTRFVGKVVTFPIAFPNGATIVNLATPCKNVTNNNASFLDGMCASFENYNNGTGGYITLRDVAQKMDTSYTIRVSWVAIGY